MIGGIIFTELVVLVNSGLVWIGRGMLEAGFEQLESDWRVAVNSGEPGLFNEAEASRVMDVADLFELDTNKGN